MTKTAATRSKQWAQSEENNRIRRWRSSVVGMDHRTCMIFDLRDGCGVWFRGKKREEVPGGS
jgi:hypothetical protein